MTDVLVVDDLDQAHAIMSPVRVAILERLATPDSAAGLARSLDVPRQRLGYHLRELEARGLVVLVEERRRGNATERFYRRAGDAFAIATTTLGTLGPRPEALQDHFSSAYQIALASRTVDEIGALQRGADRAGQRLPTLGLDAEIRFRDPAARHAFAEDLTQAIAAVIERHHDAAAAEGRTYRLCLSAYPKPRE